MPPASIEKPLSAVQDPELGYIRSKTDQIRYYSINFRGFAGACIRNLLAKVHKGLRRVNAETDHSICRDGEFLQMNEP